MSENHSGKRSWADMLSDDLIWATPVALVLVALVVTTFQSGVAGNKFAFAAGVTLMAVGPLSFVMFICRKINTFREELDR